MADNKDAKISAGDGDKWYLQKQDGSEYGPETLETMSRWAAESRLVSGNKLSNDRKEWTAVEDIPELGMDWLAELPDGRRYGPFNIAATQDLVAHKVLPKDAALTHRQTGETTTVSAYLQTPEEASQDSESPSDAVENAATGTEDAPAEQDGNQADAAESNATSGTAEESGNETAEPEQPATKKKRTQRKSTRRKKEQLREIDLFGQSDAPADDTESQSPAQAPDSDDQDIAEEAPVADKSETEQDSGPEVSKTDETATQPTEEPASEGPVTLKPSETEEESSEASATSEELDALKERLAKSEKEKRTATRRLNEAKAALKQLEAERDGARKIAVTQDAEFKTKLKEVEKQLEDERARRESLDAAKNAPDDKASQSASELEERLNAAMGELKKARNGEVKAAEALKMVEQKLARKTAIQDKRVQDLVSERNNLAKLIESESSQIQQLRTSLVALGIVIVVLATVLVMRGCRRTHQKDTPVSAEAVAGAPSGQPASVAPRDGQTGGVVRRVPFPVIRGTEGVRVMYSRTGSTIIFDEGVFSRGTELSADAKGILTKLAPQFRPFLAEYELLVEGHTDNQRLRSSSTYRNNTELAQARARAAARFLSENCDIPLTAMRVTSAGSSDPPYSNDTSASRTRNRTVVLKLLRHASH